MASLFALFFLIIFENLALGGGDEINLKSKTPKPGCTFTKNKFLERLK